MAAVKMIDDDINSDELNKLGHRADSDLNRYLGVNPNPRLAGLPNEPE